MKDQTKLAGRGVVAFLLALVLGAGAAGAQVNAYVAVTGATRVDVIDTATNSTTASITGTGSRNLTLSRDGAFLFSATFSAVAANPARFRCSTQLAQQPQKASL